jgi:hypothetical protein
MSPDTKNHANNEDPQAPVAGEEAAASHLSAIDFSTFVLSLSTSALYQMGLVPPPEGGEKAEPDLALARHSIDVLKMLRDKTRGNLDTEEAKLMESLIYELHTRFVEIDRGHAGSGGGS